MTLAIELLFLCSALAAVATNILGWRVYKIYKSGQDGVSVPSFSILNSVENMEFHRFIKGDEVRACVREKAATTLTLYRMANLVCWLSLIGFIAVVAINFLGVGRALQLTRL